MAIARDVLRALDGVHSHPLEIVRRDVKPSNVLFDEWHTIPFASQKATQLGNPAHGLAEHRTSLIAVVLAHRESQ